MTSDLELSLYHSSDYYCGVIHFVMSLASPDLHVRPLAAGGETDDLVGVKPLLHMCTHLEPSCQGLLCSHTSRIQGPGLCNMMCYLIPVVPICRGLWKYGRGYRDLVFVEFNSLWGSSIMHHYSEVPHLVIIRGFG